MTTSGDAKDGGPATDYLGPPIVPLGRSIRVLITAVSVIYMASWTATNASRPNGRQTDFAQVWFAARALIADQNPYAIIGPGRTYEWMNDFYYPLTAAIAAVPLSVFSRVGAEVMLAVISTGMLSWTLTRFGLAGVILLVSPSSVHALQLGQWSPLFTCALLMPRLGMLLAVKPTIGAAIFAARPSWWPILGGAILTAGAFLAQPGWIADWFAALRSTDVVGGGAIPYVAPILRPGGALLVLALLRWRLPEGRLLLVLACVPQTPLLYETLPLLLIARSQYQALWFLLIGWLVLGVEIVAASLWELPKLQTDSLAILVGFYFTSLALVLGRPNEGLAPDWIEHRVARLPSWIRGRRPNRNTS